MSSRAYDPGLTRAHLSNRFLGSLIRYFTETFGIEQVRSIVEEAGLSLEYLYDTTRWTSVEFDRRLCDAVAHQIGRLDEAPGYDHPLWQHWRRASSAMFDRQEIMGPLFLLLWSFEHPAKFFANIDNLYSRGNRVTRMELVVLGPGRAVVRARLANLLRVDRPGTCWSRRGLFESIPTIWKLPRATVVHPPERCIHRTSGVEHCEYEVRYPEPEFSEARAVEELARIRKHIRTTVPKVLESMNRQYDEHREAQLAQRKTAHYLPPHLVEKIRINPEAELILGGEQNIGAVLFADVVGFTDRSRRYSADEIMTQLNLYFDRIEPLIEAHGGIVDKRMGDGIMVVFVSPERAESIASLAACAVRCGLSILDYLAELEVLLRVLGAEPFQVRVGVAAGSLVQGNLGSRSRMEYTVIGEAVNLASRMEAAASPNCLLCPSDCLAQVEPELYDCSEEREVEVKGVGKVRAAELRPSEEALRTPGPTDSSIMRSIEDSR